MSDLRHLPPPSPAPGPGPRRPNRTVILIAGLLALAVVATLVFVLVRPGGTPGTPIAEPPEPPAGEDTSAGKMLNWGDPSYTELFDKPLGEEWQLYDGVGHGDNGIRSPEAIDVSDGLLTITGDSEGTTGGMSFAEGQMYGRWEGRVKAPVGDETYNALMLLWPDAENWPEGGEVDFMEMTDPTRQRTKFFIHYTEDDLKQEGEVRVDATEWHNWAVEWTPEHFIAYLDGREWFRTTDPEVQPPGPMHLTIQLDWFPEQGDEKDVEKSEMQVDWIKQYPPDN